MEELFCISDEDATQDPIALFQRVKTGKTAIVQSAGKADVMLELISTPAGERSIRIFLAPQLG